jgi:hypothetical protein
MLLLFLLSSVTSLPPPLPPSPLGVGLRMWQFALSDAIPFQVDRALLQRVISDPHDGFQAQINELLESIDCHGDFDGGTKKLGE